MAKNSPTWAESLSATLDETLGYGASKKLAEAVERTPPTVQRWKNGEVPTEELWPKIDAFFGREGWTSAVVRLCREVDELGRQPASAELDLANEELGRWLDLTGERAPLPTSERERLEALERGQQQQQQTIEELRALVDSIADQLRDALGRK